ncbi:hypothetical protein C5167_021181 [Papaver somniferum]|uniref:ABC-2 type transporter transmembrane domain-containing protein n=1 Tax=Papaver somniferum TaxID=3469 RepID=A0A4Y7IZ26_PAPSO|nr:hypothetical protein C5167_021181 [Papaver somniferum]
MLVKVLQRIARSGRIVIMSVHQPSSRVVGLLDRLMFLSQGETVYYGSPSNLSILLSDFGHPVPENEDRTEFMLDLYRELEGVPGGTKNIVEFNKSWQEVHNRSFSSDNSHGLEGLSFREAISAVIARRKHIYRDVNHFAQAPAISEFANPSWVEIMVLVKRWLTNSKRMPKLFLLRIGGVMFVGSILASVFWQLDKTEGGVQERIGFFIFIVTTIFVGCTDVLAIFLQDSFLFYFLAIFASFWAGNSLVSFVSGLVSHVMLGYIVIMPAIGAFLLFSGFFIQRNRIPPYWIWFHYMSVVKYPIQAVFLNEFDNPNLCLLEGVDKSCLVNGLNIVTKLNATDFGKWSCLWITVALGVFF